MLPQHPVYTTVYTLYTVKTVTYTVRNNINGYKSFFIIKLKYFFRHLYNSRIVEDKVVKKDIFIGIITEVPSYLLASDGDPYEVNSLYNKR